MAATKPKSKPKSKQAKKPTVKKSAPKKAAPKKEETFPEAVVGQFCEVVSGEHEGRYGVFLERASEDDDRAIVVTRDESNERLVVDLKDLRPSEAGKR